MRQPTGTVSLQGKHTQQPQDDADGRDGAGPPDNTARRPRNPPTSTPRAHRPGRVRATGPPDNSRIPAAFGCARRRAAPAAMDVDTHHPGRGVLVTGREVVAIAAAPTPARPRRGPSASSRRNSCGARSTRRYREADTVWRRKSRTRSPITRPHRWPAGCSAAYLGRAAGRASPARLERFGEIVVSAFVEGGPRSQRAPPRAVSINTGTSARRPQMAQEGSCPSRPGSMRSRTRTSNSR